MKTNASHVMKCIFAPTLVNEALWSDVILFVMPFCNCRDVNRNSVMLELVLGKFDLNGPQWKTGHNKSSDVKIQDMKTKLRQIKVKVEEVQACPDMLAILLQRANDEKEALEK